MLKILDDDEVKKWEKRNSELDSYSISKFKWQDWYNYGIEKNDPFFVKFMTLWIAFNQIYSKFSREVPNKDKDGTHHSEAKQIKECLNNDIKTGLLKKELFEQIFTSPFIKIFEAKPVCRYNITEKEFVEDSYKNNETVRNIKEKWQERIKALFMMMYQVRCNLFHGSKKTSEPRDVKLVQCSGEILEIYLEGTSDRPSIEYNMVLREEK